MLLSVYNYDKIVAFCGATIENATIALIFCNHYTIFNA